jgi:hypothetical protein
LAFQRKQHCHLLDQLTISVHMNFHTFVSVHLPSFKRHLEGILQGT